LEAYSADVEPVDEFGFFFATLAASLPIGLLSTDLVGLPFKLASPKPSPVDDLVLALDLASCHFGSSFIISQQCMNAKLWPRTDPKVEAA
jgi:hypothetical protein